MKVRELIKVLQQHDPQYEVYFNDGDGPCCVEYVGVVEMEDNVSEWNMKAGYTYLELSN